MSNKFLPAAGKESLTEKGINWRKQIAYTGLYQRFKENLLWGRKGISKEGYVIFYSLFCMCAPLKKWMLCFEKAIPKNLQSAQWSQIPEGRRVHKYQMHLSCYQSGRLGMSAQWSISSFIFWESGLVTDYKRRKMEIVQREAVPSTVMFYVVWWPFSAGDRDSWRNLYP